MKHIKQTQPTVSFTAGKWQTECIEPKSAYVIHTDEQYIAKVFGDNAEADARLITSAPEMYDWLKCIYSSPEVFADEECLKEEVYQLLSRINGEDITVSEADIRRVEEIAIIAKGLYTPLLTLELGDKLKELVEAIEDSNSRIDSAKELGLLRGYIRISSKLIQDAEALIKRFEKYRVGGITNT